MTSLSGGIAVSALDPSTSTTDSIDEPGLLAPSYDPDPADEPVGADDSDASGGDSELGFENTNPAIIAGAALGLLALWRYAR